MDSLEILNPNALIAFLSSRASIDLQVQHIYDMLSMVYFLIHVNNESFKRICLIKGSTIILKFIY